YPSVDTYWLASCCDMGRSLPCGREKQKPHAIPEISHATELTKRFPCSLARNSLYKRWQSPTRRMRRANYCPTWDWKVCKRSIVWVFTAKRAAFQPHTIM